MSPPIARLKVLNAAALVATHEAVAVASRLAVLVERHESLILDEIPTRQDRRDWPAAGELLDEADAIRLELRLEYRADVLLAMRWAERNGWAL